MRTPTTLFGVSHGPRNPAFQRILNMTEEELHEAYPFTSELVFNEKMQRGEFSEARVPESACFYGNKPVLMPQQNRDGEYLTLPERRSTHRWVVGNEAGEILPRYLESAFVAMESGDELFNDVTRTRTSDPQRMRLYAIIRQAQLRAISPFDVGRNAPLSNAKAWSPMTASPASPIQMGD